MEVRRFICRSKKEFIAALRLCLIVETPNKEVGSIIILLHKDGVTRYRFICRSNSGLFSTEKIIKFNKVINRCISRVKSISEKDLGLK